MNMRTQLRKLIRALTQDKGPSPDPPERTGVLTTEQIGPKRFKTPSGFLLCKDVPIARIGVMMYGPGETPIKEGADGIAWVTRTADDLFRPETIASFEGAPVVDEHPPVDVTPKNWKELARGHAMNVRRGEGVDADVLLADLLITDEETIAAIDAMKREVSAGYEADYEQTGPGEGSQTELLGNHVALVERGRCGPRCAIGDHNPFTEEGNEDMATQQITRRVTPAKPRVRLTQKVLDALAEMGIGGEPDASTMDEEGEPAGSDSHTHIHIHGIGTTPPGSNGAVDVDDDAGAGAGSENNSGMNGNEGNNEARFASLENGHKEIIAQLAAITKQLAGQGGSGGEQTGDEETDPEEGKTDDEGNPFAKKDDEEDDKDKNKEKSKTGDSAALATSYQALIADAEVLVPGFRVSTFDAKAKRKSTVDAMCNTRRKALDAVYATSDGKVLIDSVSGVKTIDTATMDCAAVGTLFRAAAGAKRLLNNSNATRDASHMGMQRQDNKPKSPQSLADLNKFNREFYANR
jgi:hypothetical protein